VGSNLGRDKIFVFEYKKQSRTDVEPTQPSSSMSAGGPFPEVKFPGRTANMSQPFNAEGKNGYSLAIWLHGVSEENFFIQQVN